MSPNSSAPSSTAIIEKLRQQLDATERRLQYAELKIQVLEERLRLRRIEKYGPGSEKLNKEQLELLELEPGVSTAEVQAESAREPLPARPAEKRVQSHPGRQALPRSCHEWSGSSPVRPSSACVAVAAVKQR